MTRKYRVWQVRQGPQIGIWAVALDRTDGRRGKPFIYGRSLDRAVDRLCAVLRRRDDRRRHIYRDSNGAGKG